MNVDTNKNEDDIAKALGEPFATEFSDYVRRLRGALLVISSAVVFSVWQEISISLDAMAGLKFEGLEYVQILKGLLIINAYMLIHFIWCSVDYWMEWRIRLTGTKTAFVTAGVFTSSHGDYPSNPRQSTLMNWLNLKFKARSNLSFNVAALNKAITESESKIKAEYADKSELRRSPDTATLLTDVKNSIGKVENSLNKIEETINSERLSYSLERFTNYFKLFLKSQGARWFLIELGLPIVLGATSVGMLLIKTGYWFT